MSTIRRVSVHSTESKHEFRSVYVVHEFKGEVGEEYFTEVTQGCCFWKTVSVPFLSDLNANQHDKLTFANGEDYVASTRPDQFTVGHKYIFTLLCIPNSFLQINTFGTFIKAGTILAPHHFISANTYNLTETQQLRTHHGDFDNRTTRQYNPKYTALINLLTLTSPNMKNIAHEVKQLLPKSGFRDTEYKSADELIAAVATLSFKNPIDRNIQQNILLLLNENLQQLKARQGSFLKLKALV